PFKTLEKEFFQVMNIIDHSKNGQMRKKALQQLFNLSQKDQFALAQDTLAGFYLHGEGVPKSEKIARILFELAAQKNYGPSQFNCGIMYKNAQGGTKNLQKALHYLNLAAKNQKDLGDLTLDAAYYRDEILK